MIGLWGVLSRKPSNSQCLRFRVQGLEFRVGSFVVVFSVSVSS